MEYIQTLLGQQPMMALFLTIAIGYLAGRDQHQGVLARRRGGALRRALHGLVRAEVGAGADGRNARSCALPLRRGHPVRQAVLHRAGSPSGQKANLLALIGVLSAGAVSLLFVKTMGLDLGFALGLFAGSGTSTPTLQAAIATLGNDNPAVGYSVSYPFGVAGPILFLYIAFMILKPKIEAPTSSGLEMLEIALRNPDLFGKTIGEVTAALPAGVQIVALRRESRNEPASPNSVVAESDVLLATAPTKEALAQAEHAARRGCARPLRQGSPGPRLSARVRLAPDRGRQGAGRSRPAGGEGVRPRPGPPRRRRHPAAPGSRARVRRPRRRARPSRRFRGDAQVLRRLDQGHRGIQLHLHRHRHGARLPDRRDPDSAAVHRQALGGVVGRADHRADPRQPAPHRRHELDHSAVRQSRPAQSGAHAVSRAGRDVLGAQIRRDGHRDRLHDAGSRGASS